MATAPPRHRRALRPAVEGEDGGAQGGRRQGGRRPDLCLALYDENLKLGSWPPWPPEQLCEGGREPGRRRRGRRREEAAAVARAPRHVASRGRGRDPPAALHARRGGRSEEGHRGSWGTTPGSRAAEELVPRSAPRGRAPPSRGGRTATAWPQGGARERAAAVPSAATTTSRAGAGNARLAGQAGEARPPSRTLAAAAASCAHAGRLLAPAARGPLQLGREEESRRGGLHGPAREGGRRGRPELPAAGGGAQGEAGAPRRRTPRRGVPRCHGSASRHAPLPPARPRRSAPPARAGARRRRRARPRVLTAAAREMKGRRTAVAGVGEEGRARRRAEERRIEGGRRRRGSSGSRAAEELAVGREKKGGEREGEGDG